MVSSASAGSPTARPSISTLTADRLDQRWMALPEGTHTLTVRAADAAPQTKRIEVTPGGSQTVDFASHP
jgi:hypothetical protein